METIILEIRDAEGGEDAKLLVQDMTEIYLRSIKQQDFTLQEIEINTGLSLLTIEGNKVKEFYQNEIGGHRWQRVPPTEKYGRVQTSTVTVAVMDPNSKLNYKINQNDVEKIYTRGTGAGGQHKNVTNSCVILRHKPTNISARIDGRNQHQNEKSAWTLLQIRLNEFFGGQAQNKISETRREQIGTGMRGNKRRTYRVKDNLVIDHITGKKTSLKSIQRGNIDTLHE